MIHKGKKFILGCLLLMILLWPAIEAKAVMPTLTTGDVTASAIATKNWIEEAWVYMRDKVATIFFQNILRQVLNEFASDAAKYIAAGGKGQQALYVTEKWSKFWTNIGDAALGDFIESFANSVISDIAADEIVSGAPDLCSRQKDECMAKTGYDMGAQKICLDQYDLCLTNTADESIDYEICKQNKRSCEAVCRGTYSGSAAADCLESCETVYLACSTKIGGSTGTARRAPMFKASDSPLAKINICNPSLSVAMIVTLGLTQTYTGGYRSDCSFSEMVKNWKDQYQRLRDISSEDFLQRLSGMFKQGGSDLSAAFSLHTNLIEYRNKQVDYATKTTMTNKGWLDDRNIAGDALGVPGQAESMKKLADQALIDNIGKVTGDILIDASNIFLNQLAFNLWQNLMGNLTSYSGSGNLSYYSGAQVGRAGIENRLEKMTEPVFSDGGKLNVLSNLTACPNPAKPAPDNCVITSQFSDAVSGKMTVIDAVRSGRLPADWPFGFDKNGEDKIPYNQGYAYRSLLILRKYRILPVGWELAAQEIQRRYISGDFADRPGGVTLGDLLACFSVNDNLKGYDAAWCRGLVDPNWILKVPEYYCAREGYGPQLLKDPDLVPTGKKYCSADNGLTIAEVEGKEKVCTVNDDCCTLAEAEDKQRREQTGKLSEMRNFSCAATCVYEEQKILVYRNDNYCADEQGCIKEGRNGSCLFYGYCTSERRKWVFNKNNQDQACDPMYNTCQSFKSPEGKTVSYLTNTLDYACNQSGVGCKEYSYSGAYEAAGDKVNWYGDQNIYFNKKVSSCTAKDEGCHEFIRVRDGEGVNILPDSGFEANDKTRWSPFGSVVSKAENSDNLAYGGGYSLRVPMGARGLYYGAGQKTLLPDGFEFEHDRYYTVSAFIYPVEGMVELVMGNSGKSDSYVSVYSRGAGYWQELVLTILNDKDLDINFFALRAVDAADFYVDNAAVMIGKPKTYSPYGANGLVYEKLLPTYLESSCYKDIKTDFNLKDNAPARCLDFVRKCHKDDVGCELYTEVNTKDAIAAQVKPIDYCPAECVGYNTFIQQANNFYSARDAYFIPATARSCNAKAVGCSLFVNLDKLKEGGESNEYFSNLRRCVKPDDSCAEFYTWEGSDQSGYQLVVYQLQENVEAGISQPLTVDDENPTDTQDGDLCNDLIYSLPNDHPDYNADCRQFYGRDGNVSYHLISKTVVCSNACYPYRLVENNIDVSIASEAACRQVAFADGDWRYGFWDTAREECVRCLNGSEWQTEHQACVFMADPDKSLRCGANESGCSRYDGNFSNNVRVIFNSTFENNNLDGWGPTTKISSEALAVGGHSIQITSIDNHSSGWFSKSVNGKLKVGKRYVLSFVAKKKVNDASLSSIMMVSKDGSSSNRLTFAENVDLAPDWKQYKFDIKDLSAEDLRLVDAIHIGINGQNDAVRLDNIKLLEMSDTYYLIKNSWQTPAVCDQDIYGRPAPLYMLGCSQYTDRDNKQHNLKSFDKLCQDSAVGCELMIDTFNSSYYGEETLNGLTVPADKFAYIVYEKSKECRAASKGCDRLGQSDNAAPPNYKDVYLLNNPDNYRTILCTSDQLGCEAWGTSGGGEAYFKQPGDRLCEFRQNGWYKVGSEEVCGLDYNKTIGLGEPSEKVQPIGMAQGGNVGLCPANQSGCTEYIDPESRISYDLLSGGPVELKADTLYILKNGTISGCSDVNDKTPLPLFRLDNDNNLVSVNSVNATQSVSDEFYVSGLGQARSVQCTISPRTAELREALVNYRLKDSLNKNRPTNVDFIKGQVLFNERGFIGGKYSSLEYDINATTEAGEQRRADPIPPKENNANVLLQVDPDRECATWLGCRSYIENPNKPGEKICYERGLCNRLNEAGECINFVTPVAVNSEKLPVNQTYATTATPAVIANLTGFSKVGYVNNNFNADLYHLANMKQEGESKVKFDGSFENTFYSGFTVYNNDKRAAAVISDAKILEKELGFGSYKLIPDGRAVAKTNEPVVKIVDNVGGRYYVVSAWVYMRYGSKVDLTIGNIDDAKNCPLESINNDTTKRCDANKAYGIVASTNTIGRWVRLSGKFAIANTYQASDGRETKIKVGLYTDGLLYFDDVRIEPALKAADNIYLHSDCRLYPEQDAMSCDYYNASGLRKKGWAGYCLEYDPRNPGACLLWYPVDKVESEEYEEGVALSISRDLYYCVDAEDQCNAHNITQPEFYCKKFIKVDKNSYWYHRVAANSQYVIPYQLLDSTATGTLNFYADFGVNGGGKTDPIILDQKAGSGFFGAYSTNMDLNRSPVKATLGVSNKKLMPFVPYFGWSQAGAGNNNYYCRATLNNLGQDWPFSVELGDSGNNTDDYDVTTPNKYDICSVRAAIEGDFDEDGCRIEDTRRNNVEKNDACCDWDPSAGRCRIADQDNPQYCGVYPGFSCGYYKCVGHYSNAGICRQGDPQPMINLGPDPDVRCSAAKQEDNRYKLRTTDTYGEGNEVLCLFDCFNHTNYYRVARGSGANDSGGISTANRAVKTLFTRSEGCYEWTNAGTEQYYNKVADSVCGGAIQTPPDCPGNVRPSDNIAAEYCRVRPEVKEVKLNDNLLKDNSYYLLPGSGWVILRFTTKVDEQQLPLTWYRVNWGFGGVSLVRNVNMYSRPEMNSPHTVYYFLDVNDMDNCAQSNGGVSCPSNAQKCCVIRPSVEIKDNWGAVNSGQSAYLDKPLMVVKY